MASLSDMAARLEAQVPTLDGVPADYGRVIQDAINHLSQSAPLIRRTGLSIVKGQADYAMPGDFLWLIGLERTGYAGEVIVSSDGLVPVGADGIPEQVMIAGDMLTIYPEPTYNATATLVYAAFHAPGEDGDTYATLTPNLARLAVVYGSYLALTEQAQKTARDAWRYEAGDERIDKTRQAQALQEQANVRLQEFERAIDRLTLTAGQLA